MHYTDLVEMSAEEKEQVLNEITTGPEEPFKVTEEWPDAAAARAIAISLAMIIAAAVLGMALWPITGGL